jgi:hypothetical protein
LVALALSLALMGCAGPRGEMERAAFRPTPGKAVIVGTASYTDNGVETISVNFWLENATIPYASPRLRVPVNPRQKVISGGGGAGAVRATVFAFEVAPGDYQLADWALSGESWLVKPTGMQPRRFTVRPDEVLYIGNLHMTYDTDKLYMATNVPTRGHPSINDAADRDIPLIKEKYEALAGVDIHRGSLPTGDWPAPRQTVEFVNQQPQYIIIPVRK